MTSITKTSIMCILGFGLSFLIVSGKSSKILEYLKSNQRTIQTENYAENIENQFNIQNQSIFNQSGRISQRAENLERSLENENQNINPFDNTFYIAKLRRLEDYFVSPETVSKFHLISQKEFSDNTQGVIAGFKQIFSFPRDTHASFVPNLEITYLMFKNHSYLENFVDYKDFNYNGLFYDIYELGEHLFRFSKDPVVVILNSQDMKLKYSDSYYDELARLLIKYSSKEESSAFLMGNFAQKSKVKNAGDYFEAIGKISENRGYVLE